jgi:hypothetical protein
LGRGFLLRVSNGRLDWLWFLDDLSLLNWRRDGCLGLLKILSGLRGFNLLLNWFRFFDLRLFLIHLFLLRGGFLLFFFRFGILD